MISALGKQIQVRKYYTFDIVLRAQAQRFYSAIVLRNASDRRPSD